jgi:hypothetical protein
LHPSIDILDIAASGRQKSTRRLLRLWRSTVNPALHR